MNLKTILITVLLFSTLSCSTQTKTEKLNAGLQDVAAVTGALVSGTIPPVVPYVNNAYNSNAHTILITGVVLCDNNPAYDFSKLQIEISENNKTSGVYEINDNGTFKITTKSTPGEHEIRLIMKNRNNILDKKLVSSNNEKDTFQISFNKCP